MAEAAGGEAGGVACPCGDQGGRSVQMTSGPLKTEANPYICVNTRDIYKIISPSFLYTRVRNMYGPYGPYGPQPLEQGNLMVHSGIRRMDRMDWTRAERNTEMETRR